MVTESLALTPEQVAELAPLQQKTAVVRGRRRSKTKFVMLPYEQTLVAASQLQNAELAVLIELARLAFKLHQNPVPLSNATLRAAGVPRNTKARALQRLEKAGLIAVAWRGQKCPLVTVRWK
jgi:hypothetical protein